MTDGTSPAIGDVWRYPFLWSREASRGETEGRKAPPVAMALVTRNSAGDLEVLMVPITSQPPRDNPFAIAVPDTERRRAGLDAHVPLWIIVDEANIDLPEHSYYFEPGAKIGAFSARFTKTVQTLMIQAIKERRLSRTMRR